MASVAMDAIWAVVSEATCLALSDPSSADVRLETSVVVVSCGSGP